MCYSIGFILYVTTITFSLETNWL